MTKILILGTGYVGLTSAACFAHLGHDVLGVDIDEAKVQRLLAGELPIYEEGLEELVHEGLASGRLTFTSSFAALGEYAIVFLCLPTPASPNGSPDISALRRAVESLRADFAPNAVLVTKSTVPLGTHQHLERWLDREDISAVSNPEFLREGTAVADFLKPDRVVVGARDFDVGASIAALYETIEAPVQVTDPLSAELIKYAANSFLATKLSFVNEMARLSDEVGADITAVTAGLAADHRIASSFLAPGPGWGGSCFPKDVQGLAYAARSSRLRLAVTEGAQESNRDHFEHLVSRIRQMVDRPLAETKIAFWGLAFKAGTDDTRSSPALELIERLQSEHCAMQAYDPIATVAESTVTCGDKYEICRDAHLLVVATEWAEFGQADLDQVASAMATPMIFDTRGIIDPDQALAAGITLHRLGRPSVGVSVITAH